MAPVTIVAVLYFILFVFFSQSNSISTWLSEDSIDAGKCNTVTYRASCAPERRTRADSFNRLQIALRISGGKSWAFAHQCRAENHRPRMRRRADRSIHALNLQPSHLPPTHTHTHPVEDR